MPTTLPTRSSAALVVDASICGPARHHETLATISHRTRPVRNHETESDHLRSSARLSAAQLCGHLGRCETSPLGAKCGHPDQRRPCAPDGREPAATAASETCSASAADTSPRVRTAPPLRGLREDHGWSRGPHWCCAVRRQEPVGRGFAYPPSVEMCGRRPLRAAVCGRLAAGERADPEHELGEWNGSPSNSVLWLACSCGSAFAPMPEGCEFGRSHLRMRSAFDVGPLTAAAARTCRAGPACHDLPFADLRGRVVYSDRDAVYKRTRPPSGVLTGGLS